MISMDQDTAYEIASADFIVAINANEMTRLREALTSARRTAEETERRNARMTGQMARQNASAAREQAVAYNDLLARLRQIETGR